MSALLEVRALSRVFGGVAAVDKVAFDIQEGDLVGLIGPNGAGKTTTFDLLVGLERPSGGSIRLRGREIAGLAPHRIAALGLTKTFQNATLFEDMSVEDNVLVGALLRVSRVGEARAVAREMLERVGILEKTTERAKELNVVDRARLEIARALATRPSLLLLDEVMAGLTPRETDTAMKTIRAIRGDGVSVMLVEHNMRAVMSLCERIIAFDHGAKIAEGTPREVSTHPRVIESYLGKERIRVTH